jgi:predicted DNA-binding transcriptional regulator AlpA
MKQETASRFLGKKLATFNQVCEVLGQCSRGSLYNYLSDKQLAFSRPIKLANDRVFFFEDEVSEWLAAQKRVGEDEVAKLIASQQRVGADA